MNFSKNIVLQICRAVLRYHQEQKSKEIKAEKEETVRMRRIAGSVAKEVKQFWASVEKVIFFTSLPDSQLNT